MTNHKQTTPTKTTWPMVRAWLDARSEFAHAGQRWVAIRLNTGRVEIYRVDDGLEMFQGYADRPRGYPALPAPLVVAALAALANGWRLDRVRSQFAMVAR